MSVAKTFLCIVLGLGLFALGYFWGVKSNDRGSPQEERTKAGDMPTTRGMGSMGGMEGMAPGMVMVSPDKQQLIGVRTAVVERRLLGRTVRTVGTITYDETKLSRIHSKIEGWVEKLYVNYTGKLVEKGQPLFTIYSPDLLATQAEYLLALKNQERLAASSLPEVRSGAASLVQASKKRLMLWDISEKQIRDLEERGEPQKTLSLYASHSGFVIKKDIYEGMKVMPDKELYAIADLSTVWVNVDIYESEIPFVKVGQQGGCQLLS